jgi:predicted AlkP superfamily pyrophosphatase or phosphodiesterase
MTAIQSSKWIADATVKVLEKHKPSLTITYIPHLDYSSQKFGPAAEPTTADVKAVDSLVDELRRAANALGAKLVVVSEYSPTPVRGAVALNRILRKAGLLDLRVVADREYLDTGGSAAFAMVDHQIAHVYCNDASQKDKVAGLMREAEGIAEVLVGRERAQRGLDHNNSGDVVVLAEKDRWFSYYWWLDEKRAPDFAFTVDIHRKPGYDPVELFFDRERHCIPTDASLVKGSHGLVSDEEDGMAVLVSEVALPIPAGRPLPATEFAKTIVSLF